MTDYSKLNIEQYRNARPDEDGFIVVNGLIQACAILQQKNPTYEQVEQWRKEFNAKHGIKE